MPTITRRAGIPGPFVQDNHSRSVRGTIRGLHLQVGRPQGKLIRVVSGEIFDVAVDVRLGSPTFGQWVGVSLSAESFRQYFIPAGFAHGFSVQSDVAEIEYKCTDFYDPATEIGVAWDDPALAIDWKVEHADPLAARSRASAAVGADRPFAALRRRNCNCTDKAVSRPRALFVENA